MTKPKGPSRRRWWLAVLGTCLVLAAADAGGRLHLMRGITALDAYGNVQTAPDAHSPTGYESGQRMLILPGSSLDGYHWIMQTQRMLAEGTLRVRTVGYDNAPDGREVHWASPLRWWLGLLAWGHHAVTNTPVAVSVEQMAPLANPLLHAALLVLLVPLTARRFGAMPAALLAAGMVAVYPFYESFQVAGPDHHGLALACSLLMLLCLLAGGAGWVRAETVPPDDALAAWLPDVHGARRWFAASASAGAAGLWISAATVLPVIAAVAVGALIGNGWLGRRAPSTSSRPEPGLWLWWGRIGGSVSLACYLVEYFPGHLALRLEVNHPLYALAWLGAGDLVRRGCLWWSGKRPWHSPGDGAFAAVSLLAAIAPVVVILVLRERVFAVLDPVVAAVPITEFLSLRQALAQLPPLETLVGISPLPLIVVVMAYAWWRWQPPAPAGALLALPLVCGTVALALASYQLRWLGLACSLGLAGLVACSFVASLTRQHRSGSWMGRATAVVLLAAVLLPHPVYIVRFGLESLRGQTGLTQGDMRQVAQRDLARWLRSRVGDEPAVVLAGPGLTTGLIYHGGFQGIGTFYWENREGLRTAMEIFGATLDTARERLRRQGVTHITLASWERFPAQAPEWLRQISSESAAAVPFINTLADPARAPAWLRPVFIPLADHDYLRNEGILVYEVLASDPNPSATLVDRAHYLVEAGRPGDAMPLLRNVLTQEARNLPALILLAQIQISLRDAEGFAATVTRLQGLAFGTVDLRPADRIGLALVLTIAGENEAAAREIATALTGTDEAGLRRLSPLVLADLVGLAREHGLAESHHATLTRALALIPPAFLAQLGLSSPTEAAR